MSEDLTALVSKRGRIKATLTRISGFIEKSKPETVQLGDLLARSEIFSNLWSTYGDLQDQILVLDPTDSDAEIFEESFFATKAKLDTLISSLQFPKIEHVSDNASETGTVIRGACSHNHNQSFLQLEKMKLPEFDGSYSKWLNFRDTFVSQVHEPKSIPVIFKFHRLKSLLSGEPSDILQSLDVTIENYPKAWELLLSRYDNNKLIIQTHIKALFNIPKVEPSNSKSLRNLVIELNKGLRSLQSLQQPVDKWDALIVHSVCSKLDKASLRAWEEYSVNFVDFDYKKLDKFLQDRCNSLEAVEAQVGLQPVAPQSKSNLSTNSKFSHKQVRDQKTCMLTNTTPKFNCAYCNLNSHAIYHCESFKKLPIDAKWQKIQELKLCSICMQDAHSDPSTCRLLKSGCRTCGAAHNSILHFEMSSDGQGSSAPGVMSSRPENSHFPSGPQVTQPSPALGQVLRPSSAVSFISNSALSKEVLLPTAVVSIQGHSGNNFKRIRVLLDSGSQVNFISEEIANILSLPRRHSRTQILGINNAHTDASEIINTKISSVHDPDFSLNFDFHVIPKISLHPVPFLSLDQAKLKLPSDVKPELADPNFCTSLPVDGLVGAQAFFSLFSPSNYSFFKLKNLYFCKSVLGWVASGTIPSCVQQSQPNHCMVAIFKTIDQFVTTSDPAQEIDEQPPIRPRSKDEIFCDTHFANTHYRDSSGRFVVNLPFKADPVVLGNSRYHAEKCFFALERKFQKNPSLKFQYCEFMREYETLSHMQEIPSDHLDDQPSFYLPHHPVFKNSTTTSIRVVFNASSKSSNGISLNDILYGVQPRQHSLFAIILRVRMYKNCFSADVAKMFRQVLIHPSQWNFQRIVWRENPNETLKHFWLITVTYGETSAPFLATQPLLQLAEENKKEFPEASVVIEEDFYMDDVFSGSDSDENSKRLQSEVSSILASAGMQLRKWCSNNPLILASIAPDDDPHHVIHLTEDKDSVSALGLCWLPGPDLFVFQSKLSFHSPPFTKRSIVSDLSKIFDPLGLITPILTKGKIFVQELWQCKADWDDILSDNLQERWSRFSAQLVDLDTLEIPRRASYFATQFELHGFSDPSESAYGACVYVLSWKDQDHPHCQLLTSKSRIAPLKTVSLPRLELSAAVLLVRLMSSVLSSLRSKPSRIAYYTDSTITLSWISGEPCQFKTFVGNRVAEIQAFSTCDQWCHVNSKSNPSDLVSRGLTPKELFHNKLWWNGPSFLLSPSHESSTRVERISINDLPEVRPIKYSLLVTSGQDFVDEYLKRFSSWNTLISVTCHILRYMHNLRVKAQKLDGNPVPPLTVLERRDAAHFILRKVQEREFSTEVSALRKGRPLKPKNKLLPLNPFFNTENGLLLVGGRISSAEISYLKKHPILLPTNHFVTRLIMIHYHETHLHIGAHSLIAVVRNRYWPLNGKALARNIIHKCVTCFKAKPLSHNQMMADLPKVRVTPARPFLSTGIDFCGPFYLKAEFRKNVKYKGYVAVFVCLVTRAIHLELVTDLSTDAFLASFRRFISRRGFCKDVYTDNATNFTGANKELKALFSKVKTQSNLHQFAATHEINWHFIPPAAPHFGGIWEAAVKSAKHHLLRTIGQASLTYEEFSTFLCQVEACLNSRPLHPSSADPNDCSALTPGHFLIGSLLTLPPDDDYSSVPSNRLKRWTYLQARLQEFWKKWSADFLNTQQHRPKWLKPTTNLTVGSLVIIREPNLPPLQWRLGRIIDVHPGRDNLVRSATVVLANKSTLKRPVDKLCPLPMDPVD